MKLILNSRKTKQGTQVSRAIRDKFLPDHSYSIEEQYFKSTTNQEAKVYKVSGGAKTIGIIATDKFYYFFDYDYCCKDDVLDTKKIKGWFEEAHGVRETGVGGNHPFTPPEGDWNINFMAPSGSILVSRYMDDEQQLGLRSFGQWSRQKDKVEQVVYSNDSVVMPQHRKLKVTTKDQVTNQITTSDSVREAEKFTNPVKLVGGSVDHPDRIMNISFGSMKTEDGQTMKHIYAQVERSEGLGFVYARNRKAKDVSLKDLLSDMHRLDFNQNLMVFSCRGYDKGVDVKWRDAFNEGPKLTDLFDVTIDGVDKSGKDYHSIVANSDKNENQRLTSRLFYTYNKELIGEFSQLVENVKVDINYKLDGNSLVHKAAKSGQTDYLSILLDSGRLEDVNMLDSSGNNALYSAVGNNPNYEVVELLLKAGSYELISQGGNKRESLLLVAASLEDEELFDLAIKYLPKELYEQKDFLERTALMLACEKGNKKMVSALIAKGVGPNCKNKYGFALYDAFKDNKNEIVDLLIDYPKTDLNKTFGFFNETILHAAIEKSQQNLVDKLLTDYPDRINLNQERAFGITPLAEAARVGNFKTMNDLLQLGADINHRSSSCHGITPLMHACLEKKDNAILWLLDHGAKASFRTTNSDEKTALDYYREAGGVNPEILKRLVVKPRPVRLDVINADQPETLFSDQLHTKERSKTSTRDACHNV
ncbi:ankyrin repeat domain-containing protein [Thiotrichales bacterium 19X7-9]|nr:ankyrin repeat domain-containing protein [Thiotrichales bacterium 19X7-9]